MITSDLNTFYVDGVLDHANGVLFIQSLVDNQTTSIDDVREFAREFTDFASLDDSDGDIEEQEEMLSPYVTFRGETYMLELK